jgi:Ca-activated chloride channel family protein
MKRLAAPLLLLALCVSGAAQTLPPPSAQGVVKLSRRERKDRIAKLAEQYRQFLTDVEPIIQQTEVDTFLILESDAQRDLYIDDFWRRHDLTEGMPSGMFRKVFYDRIETARERYKSLSTDRARAYLVHGQPSELQVVDTCELVQPMEIWTYRNLKGFARDAHFLFYVPRVGVEHVLWQPYGLSVKNADAANDSLDSRFDLISESVVATSESKDAAFNRVFGFVPYTRITHLEHECTEGAKILRMMSSAQLVGMANANVFKAPEVDPEQVRKIFHSVVMPTSGAKPLPVQLSVSYPAKQGSRTAAEMTILVPRAQLVVKAVGGTNLYSLDVVGEVLKDDKLFETYRYRFDYPADVKTDQLAVVLDRLLPPSEYQARIKIADLNGTSEAIVEQRITVPEVAGSAEAQHAKETASAALATIKERIESNAPVLRIVPLPDELLSGTQHVDTLVEAPGVAAVEFYLDGRKIMSKRQPPYSLDLDFGSVPQVHRIRAIALNDKGDVIAGDEATVNTGNDPFRVRIVSPRVAPKLHGRTRVEMAVSIPEGKQLDKLELFLNEARVATLFGPPYVQVIDVSASDSIGYLRAVASLKDVPEQLPIEDVVTFNVPQFMEEVNVHLVEMPTIVLRDGHPVNDLPVEAFTVLDEGKPVKVAKFEHVTNLPLSIGLAIDTSASMQPRMSEAQKTASQFFTNTLRSGDRAFLVSFDSQPQLIQRWSPSLADMNAGLAKLRAEESTALYDAIVYSLYNFLGVKGQRALVLVTDGNDTSSKFSYDQAIEYARRAAVPIYAIGIGIRMTEVDARFKLTRFCTETGGNAYFIDQASELTRIYTDIQNELRSQYILGFYPPEGVKPGSKWRSVDVQVNAGKAKTIRGYYP